MRKRRIILTIVIFACFVVSSCKKYLDEKPNKGIIIANTLGDLQTILDNERVMNLQYTGLPVQLSDDHYLTSVDWAAEAIDQRQNYLWDTDARFTLHDWSEPYQVVYFANVVLDQLPEMEDANNIDKYNDIKGQALFFRSFAFFHIAQLFASPYSLSTINEQGIVLRLKPGLDQVSTRSTVKETYERIIEDLKEATELLPRNVMIASRPNKASAYGMLARVYLSMSDPENSGKYADSCLQLHNLLMDFNTLNSSSLNPIPNFNIETIFWSHSNNTGSSIINSVAKIDSNLIQYYEMNDLRKQIFFIKNADSSSYAFRGSYQGAYSNSSNWQPFYGITTDEMYLTRAESFARLGNKVDALNDLNALMEKRWKIGTFIPFTAVDANDALTKILVERRKELVYRGLRWMDLRRLNVNGSNITLKRIINGTTYTLPADDKRWVVLIPHDVIVQTGIPQNPR